MRVRREQRRSTPIQHRIVVPHSTSNLQAKVISHPLRVPRNVYPRCSSSIYRFLHPSPPSTITTTIITLTREGVFFPLYPVCWVPVQFKIMSIAIVELPADFVKYCNKPRWPHYLHISSQFVRSTTPLTVISRQNHFQDKYKIWENRRCIRADTREETLERRQWLILDEHKLLH